MRPRQFLADARRIVRAIVVDDDDLTGEVVFGQSLRHTRNQKRQILGLPVRRHDDGYTGDSRSAVAVPLRGCLHRPIVSKGRIDVESAPTKFESSAPVRGCTADLRRDTADLRRDRLDILPAMGVVG